MTNENIDDEVKDIIAKVAEEAQDTKKKIKKQIQLVVFTLDQEEYGVEITDLKEIIRFQNITPVPNSPDFIRGILNLRGKIVVVIDLEKKFNLVREEDRSPQHIIIAQVNQNTFGVIVDQVKDVMRVPVTSLRQAPSLVSAKIHTDFIKGVVVLEQKKSSEKKKDKDLIQKEEKESRLIIMIDLPKMLSEKELLKMGDAVRKTVLKKDI